MALRCNVEWPVPSYTIHHYPPVIDTAFFSAPINLAVAMGSVTSGFMGNGRVVVENIPFQYFDSSYVTADESVKNEHAAPMLHAAELSSSKNRNNNSNTNTNNPNSGTNGGGTKLYRRLSEKRCRTDSDSGAEVLMSPVKRPKRPSIFVKGKEMQAFFGLLCKCVCLWF